jgi:hypothetical protein
MADVLRFLDDVLHRMQRHQQKRRGMLRKLAISELPEAARYRKGPEPEAPRRTPRNRNT